jgi:hypothetical protein
LNSNCTDQNGSKRLFTDGSPVGREERGTPPGAIRVIPVESLLL